MIMYLVEVSWLLAGAYGLTFPWGGSGWNAMTWGCTHLTVSSMSSMLNAYLSFGLGWQVATDPN